MSNIITLHISLLGDAGVGKTRLLDRFANGTFTTFTHPTTFDLLAVCLQVEADVVKLTLADNCGVERYRQVARSYNQRADALILVYDVTSKSSFQSLDYWLETIKGNCEEKVQIIVVGNKIDLPYGERSISNEDIINYAKDKEAVFMETSAKDDYNINEVFYRTVKLILKAQGLLLPGCEDDLYMRKLNGGMKAQPVPERSLKTVLVPHPAATNSLVLKSTPAPKKSSCNC